MYGFTDKLIRHKINVYGQSKVHWIAHLPTRLKVQIYKYKYDLHLEVMLCTFITHKGWDFIADCTAFMKLFSVYANPV